MAEIYYIEPSYILWIANKFQPSDRRYDRLVELAKLFSVVHFELTVQKRKIASVSQYVGKPGDKLKELFVTVLNVRLQVDSYKPDFYVDQNILAADRDGNRFTFLVKAAAQSLTPKALSCRSRKSPNMKRCISFRPRSCLNMKYTVCVIPVWDTSSWPNKQALAYLRVDNACFTYSFSKSSGFRIRSS